MRSIEAADFSDLAGLAASPFPANLIETAQPRVLRGLCRDWPLVRAARESDTAFAQLLAAHDNGTAVDTLLLAPDQRGRIGYNADMSGFNYQHFKVTITEALQKLALYSRQPQGAPVSGVAMQSAPVRDCLPGLLPALRIPFLPDEAQPRLWFGNHVTTPTHFDSQHNLAVVACGRRRFTLFPPEQVRNLYIGPPDFAPTAMAISLAHPDDIDDPRFPHLRTALEHAQSAVLEPGDALYIPPLWWHHVESLDPLNALVNYWWQPAPVAVLANAPGLDALLHALLAIRPLAASERAAWKTLFEHYVFADADPAAHIPEKQRGILGELDGEKITRLKRLAARNLPREA